jgi:hypothetical protein
MSKVTVETELPEPVTDISQEEITEIKEELASHVETVSEENHENLSEELSEEIAAESTAIKEEVKSWLESVLQPIAETLSLLTTGLSTLGEKVGSLSTTVEQLTPPVLPEPTTDLSETETAILSSAQVESPAESAEESLTEQLQEAAEAPQKVAREILKI